MGLLEEAGVEKGKGKRKRLEFDRVEFGERRDVDEFKLCGFVEAILCASQGPDPGEDFVNAEIELGASCRLEGQGNETYLEVEGSKTILVQRIIRKGDFLVSVENATASNHGVNGNRIQTEERTPGTAGTPGSGFPVSSCVSSPELEFKIDEESGSKSRRRGEGSTGRRDRHGVHGILEQLQHMEKKNKVRIGGMVVNKVQLGLHKYFVVLLDVYIPDAFFTARRSCWKGGPVIAGCLSHLRCDWDKRSQILERKQSHNLEGISNVGVCHVLGCKLHREQSGTEKAERFDLHALFKSLPSCLRHGTQLTTTLQPGSEDGVWRRGLWQMPDDVLSTILTKLLPSDLHNVAAVSRHFRALSASIMPCMNLKLFPHQESAVRWMLQRELTSRTLPHPYSGQLLTAYGIPLYFDEVTGDLSLEAPLPVTDFKGGLFCDEPGLGKTVTALSLILKTQGTLATPPPGVTVHWCEHTSDQKSGYYEVSTSSVPCGGMSALKRCSVLKARRYQFDSAGQWPSSWNPRKDSHTLSPSVTTPPSLTFGSNAAPASWTSPRRGSHYLSSSSASYSLDVESHALLTSESTKTPKLPISFKRRLWDSGGKDAKKSKRCSHSANGKNVAKQEILPDCDDNELWSQCDACGKWRKIPKEGQPLEEGLAWFCSMNKDQLHQDCSVPEEIFDKNEMIKSLPGFVHSEKGADREVNVPFFRTVLRDHAHHIDEEAKRALRWLIDLPRDKVLKGAVGGLQLPPTLQMASVGGHDLHQYDKIFDAFGLVKKKEAKKVTKWFYPRNLDNLVFDTVALREALAEPVEEVTRFYLSKATLVVVPPNLIEHWRSQITKHTSKGQLRYFIWSDVKKPPAAHILAWEYDIVITTFSRLSVEWSSRETSPLVRIHWLRIVLDEGHTLGASLSMTNKLQMAVSMQASRRWLLTGTPTPNTPSSQVAHLQPMLRFLHEEFYGKQSKLWEGAILRPFEACREEGRQRLLNLLHRCMISARKADLVTIPPCVRKVKLLEFTTEQHAASYNELVVTVKRNILMADWKDPSHVESLLNPKQWKFRNFTLKNVRLSCCVAGNIKVRNAKGDLQETMDMFVTQGMDETSDRYLNIRTSLLIGGDCERCAKYCRLPVVTPCQHLLCLSCVSLDSTKCSKCGHLYQMQSPEDRARPENPNPKWPVPQDLIELQPSYVQENWDPDWHHTSSSKTAYLIKQLKEMSCRNEKNIFSQFVDIIDEKDSPMGAAKQKSNSLPEKAIVFSQFLEHINVIEKQLGAASISCVGMYSPMPYRDKMKSLVTFQSDPECTVLVMDCSVSLGLDLSFVTNVYLMEPIWDRSMEEQVISRAHRMGATRPVLVETLAMRGTIEEQMVGVLKDLQGSNGINNAAHDPAESSILEEMDFVQWNKT